VALEFHLGRWRVAPSLNRLEADDTTVHLEPKVMQVLVRLAQQPGQVVSRDQLLAAVWADTFVTDDVLKRSISELRKALGDDARQPVYIETISKGGYRLIAPVVTVTKSDAANPVELRRLPTEPERVAVASEHESVAGYPSRWVGRHHVPAILTFCVVAGILAAAWWAGRSRSTMNDAAGSAAPVQRSLSRLTFGPGLADRRDVVTRRPICRLRI